MAVLAAGCLSAPPGGSEPGGPCGSLRALSDDFEAGLSDWRWFVEGVVSPENGGLVLAPPAEEYAAIYSAVDLLVEGGELVVEVDASEMAEESFFTVRLVGAQGAVALRLEDGTLNVDVEEPGFQGGRGSVVYDPATRWWRVARTDGHFHWATATDGSDWKDLGTFDAELSGLATIGIELHANASASSLVTLGGINPGAAPEPACPVQTFTDDFSKETPRWTLDGGDVCTVQFTGKVEIGLSAADACALVSSERFSLENSQVAIELPQAAGCTQNPTFDIHFPTGDFSLGCIAEDGPNMLAFFAQGEEVEELGSTDWDPEAIRFLRIRHAPAEGGVVYETSADGAGWDRLATATDLSGVDLSSVEIVLAIYGDGPSASLVAFDQLNILPYAE